MAQRVGGFACGILGLDVDPHIAPQHGQKEERIPEYPDKNPDKL